LDKIEKKLPKSLTMLKKAIYRFWTGNYFESWKLYFKEFVEKTALQQFNLILGFVLPY
jgi:hypothetical protein